MWNFLLYPYKKGIKWWSNKCGIIGAMVSRIVEFGESVILDKSGIKYMSFLMNNQSLILSMITESKSTHLIQSPVIKKIPTTSLSTTYITSNCPLFCTRDGKKSISIRDLKHSFIFDTFE